MLTSAGDCRATRLLNARDAAAHCGFLVKVFREWVDAALFPQPSIDGQFWIAADLDRALEQLERSGFRYVPNKKPAEYVPLPNVHRTFVILSDERKSWHYKRRGLRGPIYGEPNSPGFMKGLIQKERDFAAAHPAPAEQPASQSALPKRVATVAKRLPARTAEPAPPFQPQAEPAPKQLIHQKQAKREGAPKRTTKEPRRVAAPSIVAEAEPPPRAATADAPPHSQAPIFLTPQEVCDRWRQQIAVETLSNWRSAGIGPPATRIGRAILYRVDLLEQWEHQQLFVKSKL